MGIFLSLSYSKTFRIETINTLIPSLVPSKTIYPIPDQNGQSLYRPVFRPKRHKNPTLWGGTYLYGLYMGGPPPPPTPVSSLLDPLLRGAAAVCYTE